MPALQRAWEATAPRLGPKTVDLKQKDSGNEGAYTKSHHSIGRMLALHFRQGQTQKKPRRRSPYCCQFVHSWAQFPKSRRIMTGPTSAGQSSLRDTHTFFIQPTDC